MKKLWVDPPSGWMFGFPKIWDQTIHTDLRSWLVNEGYPQEEINKYSHVEDGVVEDNFYCRFWEAEND
jgi:hypothetical protein